MYHPLFKIREDGYFGFINARGEVVILLDADLQNDPADIPMMIDQLNQGYDVVSGWRVNRQDKFLTRILPSQTANWRTARGSGR